MTPSEHGGAPPIVGTWARPLCLVLVAIVVIALYWPTVMSIHQRWVRFDEAYSHGYLILLLSLYFSWLQRSRLRSIAIKFSPIFAIPLLLASVAWCIAQLLSVQIVAQLLVPVLLICAIATVFGYSTARCFLVPIALLGTGIPIWEDLVGNALRNLTVKMVGDALQLVSFPAVVSGYRIEIPDGAFFVAGGCSGMSFFLTGLTISMSYAYLNLTSNTKRAGFVLFCVALSLLSNWVRVGSLVVIGHLTKMQSSLITEGHLMFGWYLFAAAMVVMLVVGHFIARSDEPNVFVTTQDSVSTSRPSVQGFSAALLCLMVGPALTFAYSSQPIVAPQLKFDAQVEHNAPSEAEWQPAYNGWTSKAHGTLHRRLTDIDLDILYYARQIQTGKLISASNKLADDLYWRQSEAAVAVTSTDGPVNEAILSSRDGSRRIVWYWFDVGGARATSGLRVKVFALQRLLTRGRSDGALVTASIACPFDCEMERGVLTREFNRLEALVNAALRPTI